MSFDNDPLWRLRHALAGLLLALVLAVPIAALVGSWLGERIGDSYAARVSAYSALLLYLGVGCGLLLVRVARHETQPVSAARVLRWLASLWLWPLLLLLPRRR